MLPLLSNFIALLKMRTALKAYFWCSASNEFYPWWHLICQCCVFRPTFELLCCVIEFWEEGLLDHLDQRLPVGQLPTSVSIWLHFDSGYYYGNSEGVNKKTRDRVELGKMELKMQFGPGGDKLHHCYSEAVENHSKVSHSRCAVSGCSWRELPWQCR